jgi:hypothetical protein
MKKYSKYLFFIWGLGALGQVGVGTISPQKTLHIAGQNSTIRIESLNSTNSSLNDGIKLAPAYVDGDGDISLFPSGNSGTSSINFLYSDPNFIIDDPHGHGQGFETGVVINNDSIPVADPNFPYQIVEDTIASVTFNSPKQALLEIRYGVTTFVAGSDLMLDPSTWLEPTENDAIQIKIYFYIDFQSDGSGDELSEYYGLNGVNFESLLGGLAGYPYINGQGYMDIPPGDHTLYFIGSVKDFKPNFTSVGFGGDMDYLKIRVFE